MATAFPTALDAFTDPLAADKLSSPDHAGQHTDKNDSVEALEVKVGIDASADNTSHDYRLQNVTGGLKALGGPATPGNWKLLYQNGSGVITELSLPPTGEVFVGNGVTAAPTFETVPPRTAYIAAYSMISPATAGAEDITTEGTNLTYRTKDFDQTVEEHCDFHFRIPDEYTGGAITVRALWTADSGAGTVAWEINVLNAANDDVIDAGKTDIGSITDTKIANGDLHEASVSWSTTLPVAGETIFGRVSRDVAADNLSADARLIALVFEFNVRGS